MNDEMTGSDGIRALNDLLQPTLDQIEDAVNSETNMLGIPTGFADLDRLLNGLTPGHLIVIGGVPGVGKSTLARDITRHASCYHKKPTAVFTRQETLPEITKKILSAETRIPLHVMRSGCLNDDDWTRLARRLGEITEAPLFINNTSSNIEQLIDDAKETVAAHNIELIVVDGIQMLHTGKFDSYRELSDVSRGLKNLAMVLEIPVVAVSSSNRDSKYRTNKRPQLGDLRDSGTLEDDADVVIFVHRDDYYDKESSRAGEADFFVEKNRHGATDVITVAAQLHLSRFVEMTT